MPTPLCMEVMGPTAAHKGSGAVWQKDVKSPNGILSVWRLNQSEAPDRVAVVLDAPGPEESFGRAERRLDFKKGRGEPSWREGARNGPIQNRIDPSLGRDFPQRSMLPFQCLRHDTSGQCASQSG